jgi:hypothetical protein
MHAVVRSYAGQGASELFDALEQREDAIRDVIGGVSGFQSYVAFRTSDGGVTVSVYEDKDGAEESSRRAAEWVKENVDATVDPPTIAEGSTFIQF